ESSTKSSDFQTSREATTRPHTLPSGAATAAMVVRSRATQDVTFRVGQVLRSDRSTSERRHASTGIARMRGRRVHSVLWRLRYAQPVSDLQVVAGERIDVHHPAEREWQKVAAVGLASRCIGDLAVEAEAPVGQHSEVPIDL